MALLLAALLPRPASAEEIRTPTGHSVPILEALDTMDLGETVLALGVRRDGNAAAVATLHPNNARNSLVRLYALDLDAPRETVIQATVRDLVFTPDGSTIFGISHRGKKKRIGDTYLFTVDPVTMKHRQHNRLPRTARDLDIWAERNAVLIASVDELRTVLIDGLRSGPLFRVAGSTRSVVSLGGSLILLGQDDGLVLVDLDDPPGPETLPTRGRFAMDAPVLVLAAAENGQRVLARDARGTVFEVSPAPLGAVAVTGTSARPVAARSPDAEDPALPLPPPTQRAPTTEDTAATTAAAATAAANTPPPAAPAPAPTIESKPPPEPEPAKTVESSPPPEPDAGEAAPVPATTTFGTAASDAAVWGRILGDAADSVAEVVLFGPDNVLKEATRVPPHERIWEVASLPPGRYRVQMDAGGERVLVARPGFLVVEIGTESGVQAPDCEIVRVVEAGALN